VVTRKRLFISAATMYQSKKYHIAEPIENFAEFSSNGTCIRLLLKVNVKSKAIPVTGREGP
jgi:hypothetical protein